MFTVRVFIFIKSRRRKLNSLRLSNAAKAHLGEGKREGVPLLLGWSGGPPPRNFENLNAQRCILVHFQGSKREI